MFIGRENELRLLKGSALVKKDFYFLNLIKYSKTSFQDVRLHIKELSLLWFRALKH